jgi:hypothetical protein
VEIRPQLVIEEQLQSIFALRPMEQGELQQPIVEEQPQLVPTSRPMQEKKLQQLVSNGKKFLQELFEERLVSNIIP